MGPGKARHFSLPQRQPQLAARLLERREEIEQAILARAHTISDPGQGGDAEYLAGLRSAVGAAVEYGIAGTTASDPQPPAIPGILADQVRQAARRGILLDTVLRRYFAGYTVLGEFVMQEAAAGRDLRAGEVRHVIRGLAMHFDRLVVEISEQYRREADCLGRSGERARVERVKRLLDGELTSTAALRYELDGWHVALIASGPGATEAARRLAAGLDRQLLLVSPGADVAWVWLGGRNRVEIGQGLSDAVAAEGDLALAAGEPAKGLSGWRLTHRQAAAALPVAKREPGALVRYAEVSLLAAVVREDVLCESLHQLYLAPLAELQDGGAVLRETLRAYFAAGRNASSAAASLRVTRKTVASRLRAVEEAIGRPLNVCAAELEVALRFECLETTSIV
jgi:hypothetical protein